MPFLLHVWARVRGQADVAVEPPSTNDPQWRVRDIVECLHELDATQDQATRCRRAAQYLQWKTAAQERAVQVHALCRDIAVELPGLFGGPEFYGDDVINLERLHHDAEMQARVYPAAWVYAGVVAADTNRFT
jgi:hypothetical protein